MGAVRWQHLQGPVCGVTAGEVLLCTAGAPAFFLAANRTGASCNYWPSLPAPHLQAQGTHFFSRAGLVQSGCYQQPGGKWQGGGEPVVGQAEMVL